MWDVNEEVFDNFLKTQGDLTDLSKDCLVIEHDGNIKGFALLLKCSTFKNWWLELKVASELFPTEYSVKLFEKIMEIARKQDPKEIKFSLTNRLFVNSPLETKFNEMGLTPVQYEFWMELEDFSLLPKPNMPLGITFQKLKELEDYDTYVDILNDAFSKAFDSEVFTPEDYKSIIDVNWKKFDVEYFFAKENNKPIGFCTVMTKPPIYDRGVIMTLAVYHSHHKKGIGSYLLGLGIKTLIEKGCIIIELGVEGENTHALALYKRFGFKEVESQTMIDFVYSP